MCGWICHSFSWVLAVHTGTTSIPVIQCISNWQTATWGSRGDKAKCSCPIQMHMPIYLLNVVIKWALWKRFLTFPTESHFLFTTFKIVLWKYLEDRETTLFEILEDELRCASGGFYLPLYATGLCHKWGGSSFLTLACCSLFKTTEQISWQKSSALVKLKDPCQHRQAEVLAQYIENC